MKLFETYQKLLSFAFVRIEIKSLSASELPIVNYEYPLGLKNLIPLIVLVFAFIVLGTYPFTNEVDTFQEYSETIYTVITTLTNILLFMLLLWKRAEIFQYIDMFENEIEKSK